MEHWNCDFCKARAKVCEISTVIFLDFRTLHYSIVYFVSLQRDYVVFCSFYTHEYTDFKLIHILL